MVFHGFFKELDFQRTGNPSIFIVGHPSLIFIAGNPSMIFIDGPSMIIIDGPSMNMVPFLWAPSLVSSFGPPLGPRSQVFASPISYEFSEPGFSDFQISRFVILEIFVFAKSFRGICWSEIEE